MADVAIIVTLRDGTSVSAVRTPPVGPSNGWLFVYAPGAGSSINDQFGLYAARRLADRGVATVRFQFPYMEAGKRRPDRNAVLEATWIAVIDEIRADGLRLVAGGRSMGGRIASQVVAQEAELDALALFAYPLHPPWNRTQQRDLHFPSITCPTLFCSGARDDFATPHELKKAAGLVGRSEVRVLDGADHGFRTLKSSGRTSEDVWVEAVDALAGWLPE